MTAYMNGHTIHQHRHHGDCWYTVDELARRFASTAGAARWIRAQFGGRPQRKVTPVPGTQALRRAAAAARAL